MEDLAEDIDEGRLRNGRTMLAIALVCSAASLFAVLGNHTLVFGFFWLVSFLAGVGGIRDVARATGGNDVAMYVSLLIVFMPIFALLPLAYYFGRARSAMKVLDTSRRERSGATGKPDRAPSPRPKPASRLAPAGDSKPVHTQTAPALSSPLVEAVRKGKVHALLSAVASVKQASLDRSPDGRQVPDGAELRVRVPTAPGNEALDAAHTAIMRATQGIFAVCYLVDRGQHYTWATRGDMAEAGLDLEQLHSVGVANLLALANGSSPGLKLLPQDGFYGLVMGGQFEASLVLVDGLWEDSLRQYTPNGAVVAIPSRDMCAFCDAASEKGIAALRRIIERVTADPQNPKSHRVSERLFVRRDGRWHPYMEKPADLPPLELR